MPDRGLLERSTIDAQPIHRSEDGAWVMTGVRLAQVTFEVARESALAAMPADVSRPVPCYGRLIVLDARASPAGALGLAALLVGGRYRMLARNVLVDAIVEGGVEQMRGTFGAAYRKGIVRLSRAGARLTAAVEAEEGGLAEMELPALEAVDPTMLRWDPWLGFARGSESLELIEYTPQLRAGEAFLSKGTRVTMGSALPRDHWWRRLHNLNTISACYLEGDGSFTLPQVQQTIL